MGGTVGGTVGGMVQGTVLVGGTVLLGMGTVLGHSPHHRKDYHTHPSCLIKGTKKTLYLRQALSPKMSLLVQIDREI